jgi:hypothetical protein
MDVLIMLVGYARRLCAYGHDLVESLADFLAVSMHGLGRVALQELPEIRLAPRFCMDLAPVLAGEFSHCSSFERVRGN